MTQVQALFIDADGPYPGLLGTENCWDEKRDARRYEGGAPIVAHPPCARWCRLAESVFARTQKEEHRPGNDGGCFIAALESLKRCGGVLEHPAASKAFAVYGLPRPTFGTWQPIDLKVAPGMRAWATEVWQSAYGHPAPKRTWLVYVGEIAPFALEWRRDPGTHAVSGDAIKRRRQGAAARPRLSAKQNIATPPDFAEVLICLASWSRA
jgi:hypothetical protein